jgi:hypothetical protein
MPDRYFALFTERFHAAGLPGLVREARLTGSAGHPVLRVSISLPDEWDWTARYDVLKQASDFQTRSGVPVVCEFNPPRWRAALLA